MNQSSSKLIRLFSVLLLLVVIGFSAYHVINAVRIAGTTGLLVVKTSDIKATITVTAQNTQAVKIGVGPSKARLKAGNYQVAASDDGKIFSTGVSISLKQITTIKLEPADEVLLPALSNMKFGGLNGLISFGLTTQQVTNLENAVFLFKPTALVVNVNDSTLYNPPRDPNTADGFEIDFSLTIDKTTYKAQLFYNDLTHVTLQLDLNGASVYNSGSV